MRGIVVLGLAAAVLTGCGLPLPQQMPTGAAPQAALVQRPDVPPQVAARNFVTVVRQLEPLAEAMCRRANPAQNCDFQIAIDDRPNQPPNAFQTLDESGRPIIAFTLPLIAGAQNRDELAFIMGHEAGHHIAGHIQKTQGSAYAGAVLAGVLAQVSGLDRAGIDRAAELGAGVAARGYSKEVELEADQIGTEIAYLAGYDPVLGSAFFDRLPDPGDRFLGSHPANSARKATVLATAARLRAGR